MNSCHQLRRNSFVSRLNVEEVYWGDPRRALLIEKLGYGTADGFWLISIKLAEKFWVPNKECIPIKDWKAARLPDALFEIGFAELRNDGQEVYVFGSEEHFEWRFFLTSHIFPLHFNPSASVLRNVSSRLVSVLFR